MKITVIIPAYTMTRWETLVNAVRSCRDQSLRPDEIVVVIDYNDELFIRATEEFPEARVVANQSTKGVSGARNTAAADASGDVIACLDDDAYAQPDWLEQLTRPFADPKVVGVGGWILPHWPGELPKWFPETFYWILGCSYAGLPETDSQIRNAIGANMAIRRKVFESVGGFAEGIGRLNVIPLGCEETEIAIRYTAAFPEERFVMNREAVVHQVVPSSRLTWHYFWSRCWSEGLSKAAVAHLVGDESALSAERRHVVRAIPHEFAMTARRLFSHPRSAVTRMSLLVVGTLIAASGYSWGKLVVRQAPIEFTIGDLTALTITMRKAQEQISTIEDASTIGNPGSEDFSNIGHYVVELSRSEVDIHNEGVTADGTM